MNSVVRVAVFSISAPLMVNEALRLDRGVYNVVIKGGHLDVAPRSSSCTSNVEDLEP